MYVCIPYHEPLSLSLLRVCHIINNTLQIVLYFKKYSSAQNSRNSFFKYFSLNSNFECKNFPEDQKPLLSFPSSITNTIQGGVIMRPQIFSPDMRSGSNAILPPVAPWVPFNRLEIISLAPQLRYKMLDLLVLNIG